MCSNVMWKIKLKRQSYQNKRTVTVKTTETK